MAKLILKRNLSVVQCPKHGRIVSVANVNVPKTEITCRKCTELERETCGYVKCKAA